MQLHVSAVIEPQRLRSIKRIDKLFAPQFTSFEKIQLIGVNDNVADLIGPKSGEFRAGTNRFLFLHSLTSGLSL
jgi:hypothetical protein